MSDRDKPKYLTCREFADIVRRDIRTIYRWIREGYIQEETIVRVRDGYLIPETELARILNQQNGAFS